MANSEIDTYSKLMGDACHHPEQKVDCIRQACTDDLDAAKWEYYKFG
ncbi:MAG: hypothetical protein LBT80_01565 [Lactobacillaceae bacterium]|jgi:hypothetical protein|nr:hypothetical protein [Lactobacillaceae bacterium]